MHNMYRAFCIVGAKAKLYARKDADPAIQRKTGLLTLLGLLRATTVE